MPQDYTKYRYAPSSKSVPSESFHLPNIPVHSSKPPNSESNKPNSKGNIIPNNSVIYSSFFPYTAIPSQPFNTNLPVQSLHNEEQLLDEFDKEEEQEATQKMACERGNTASVKQSQTEVTSLDPSMEDKEAKGTLTPPISIISPLTSGVSSLPYVAPPLSGMLVTPLCTEDEDEEWVIVDHDCFREEEWVLLEKKDWEGEIDETEWVIVDKILPE